jgi:hypothetical protein
LQSKQWKDDLSKLKNENNHLNKKIRDQTRRLDKISDHSFKGHLYKSAVRHRELEYMTKRDFRAFHHKLRESFEVLFGCFQDAFKRDAKIV